MEDDAILLVSADFGEKQQTAYLKNIKKVIISRFADLATENIDPDFDKYAPNDLLVLTRYRDGTYNLTPAAFQLTISI